MRRGRRLALDVGTARIGVAISDTEGLLASPLSAITRTGNPLDQIQSLHDEHSFIEVYVGYPISLSGGETASTMDAADFALSVEEALKLPVRLIDERLTTVSAARKLRSIGIDTKSAKALIDSASAVEILEIALDFEKRKGTPPGHLIGETRG